MIEDTGLKDKWFRVCKSETLKDKPLRKNINGIPIVLFRGKENLVGALLDRCPHRNIQMSNGYIENDNLVCRFHGWHFDTGGICVKVAQLKNQTYDKDRNAVSFTTLEDDGLIYVKCNNTKEDFPQINKKPSEMKSPIPSIKDKNFTMFFVKLFIFFAIFATLIFFWFQLMPYFMAKIINS